VRGLLWLVAVGVVLLGWSLLQVTYDVLTLTGKESRDPTSLSLLLLCFFFLLLLTQLPLSRSALSLPPSLSLSPPSPPPLIPPQGRQPQLLSNQALRRMNNDSLILESYFRLARPAIHPKTRSPGTEHERATPHKYLPEEEEDISASRHKVVLVIVDGLRYDCTSHTLLLHTPEDER